MKKDNKLTILITGGCGFIGSNFIRYELENYNNVIVINIDKLTYAGNPLNLIDIEKKYGVKSLKRNSNKNPRYFFIKGDICDRPLINSIFSGEYWKEKKLIKELKDHLLEIDCVINFAAESHVDRSILDPSPFIDTNIKGVQVLLEAARTYWKGKNKSFIHISTDEVYGSLGKRGKFTEKSPLKPNSPYSASKAAADLICRSYHKAYKIPVIIIRSSNNYGPYQFPEKLIPLMIKNALEGKKLPVYGKGLNIRDWLYVKDNCRAIDLILRNGEKGEIYNVGGETELKNIEVVKIICEVLKEKNILSTNPENLIQFIPDPRGDTHDFRYSLDCSKIKKTLKWKKEYSFKEGIRKTIDWYIKNQNWVKKVVNGEYKKYYRQIYGDL